MRLEPLGDQAAMAYCESERQASLLAACVRRNLPAWCIDVVQAYVSVAIYYDVVAVDFSHVSDWLALTCQSDIADSSAMPDRLHLIPCCYEFGLDFERVQEYTRLTRDQIIARHCAAIYTVYAIGFCPGFPYLGYLPPELTGVPRLATPRLRLEVGSVGLTGKQTGIYTEVRPGGWNIVGRTPLELVSVKAEYFPLQTGDRVQFRRIDEREFRRLSGQRLP